MLVIKYNPCHQFAMIAAFDDAEWSIWPNAAVTAMVVVRRFPEEIPGPTGRGLYPRSQYRVAGNGLAMSQPTSLLDVMPRCRQPTQQPFLFMTQLMSNLHEIECQRTINTT